MIKMKRIEGSSHAGHNPDGKVACGAVGFVKESTEARAINNLVISKMRSLGHTMYDCTVNDGTSQNDVLKKIVAKCNSHDAEVVISIHLNADEADYGNGKNKGVEVLIVKDDSKARERAEQIAKAISALGFTNRGVKVRPDLYVLKKTEAPALLVECFFCDDADDVEIYKKVGAEGIATAIVAGLVGKIPNDINGDGKVDANDALEILKQVAGLSPKTGNYDANDALDILKQTAGVKNQVPSTSEKVVTGTITGTGVRVRTGPGTNYPVVTGVSKGQTVRIWKEQGSWSMIDTDMWVASKYIKKC